MFAIYSRISRDTIIYNYLDLGVLRISDIKSVANTIYSSMMLHKLHRRTHHIGRETRDTNTYLYPKLN